MNDNLTVVPFKKKGEVETPEAEEVPSPKEMFERYMEGSEATEVIICGYNKDGYLSFITNMGDKPDMCYALDLVKNQILSS